MKKDRLLLIWPPLFNSGTLSLSIPFLLAYLKRRGFEDVEALDVNGAYLRTIQPHGAVYALLRRGQRMLKKKNKERSALGAWMARETAHILEEMERKEIQLLFPSLQSILASRDEGVLRPRAEKIKRLLRDVLDRDAPGLVGISVAYPYQIFFALLIAKTLKERWSDKVRIVLGGSQVTKNIKELTQDKDIRKLVDFFVVHGGEEPLEGLLTDKDPSLIPNLYYKDPRKGEGYVSSGRSFSLSPDDYPVPDFSGFDRGAFQEMLPFIVTAGCPWGQCAFCTQAEVLGIKYRHASTENIVRNIEGMVAATGVHDFSFVDNGLPAGLMRDIAHALLEKGVKISWSCQVILDRQFGDPGFCRLLKESGFKMLNFGLESVSPRVLKLMNKYHQGLSPEDIKKILTVVHDAGIGIGIFALVGFPTETAAEARQTADFLSDNIGLFAFVNINPFFLDDLTRVFQEPERFGIKKVHSQDKYSHMGRRLTYAYETQTGMSQAEAFRCADETAALVRQAFQKSRSPGDSFGPLERLNP